jgi:plasmid stabilization system protein ParE
MRLRLARRAAADIEEIADYIKAHDPRAALRVRLAIQDTLRNIVAFPEMGRRQDIESVRKTVTPDYGYLVYYAIDSRTAEIAVLTIQHPKRERPFDDV